MSDASYEHDVLAWSRAQAAALRRREAGHNALDYDNLAEEIEDVGKTELHACESQVENILEHMLKIEYFGSPRDVPGRRREIRAFRRPLEKRLMRTIEAQIRSELDGTLERIIRDMEAEGDLTPEQAAEARGRGRTWEQVVDPDWIPEPRYGYPRRRRAQILPAPGRSVRSLALYKARPRRIGDRRARDDPAEFRRAMWSRRRKMLS